MIKVIIKKNDDTINSIVIDGHSGYSEAGSDIVCASVSSICITTVNALIRIDSSCIDYNDKDGHLEVDIKKHSEVIDVIIDNMVDLLNELEKDYKKYIKIEIRRCSWC